jgi:hypothetical protein
VAAMGEGGGGRIPEVVPVMSGTAAVAAPSPRGVS